MSAGTPSSASSDEWRLELDDDDDEDEDEDEDEKRGGRKPAKKRTRTRGRKESNLAPSLSRLMTAGLDDDDDDDDDEAGEDEAFEAPEDADDDDDDDDDDDELEEEEDFSSEDESSVKDEEDAEDADFGKPAYTRKRTNKKRKRRTVSKLLKEPRKKYTWKNPKHQLRGRDVYPISNGVLLSQLYDQAYGHFLVANSYMVLTFDRMAEALNAEAAAPPPPPQVQAFAEPLLQEQEEQQDNKEEVALLEMPPTSPILRSSPAKSKKRRARAGPRRGSENQAPTERSRKASKHAQRQLVLKEEAVPPEEEPWME